jgi:hypothetical protein
MIKLITKIGKDNKKTNEGEDKKGIVMMPMSSSWWFFYKMKAPKSLRNRK